MAIGKEIETRGHIVGFQEEISKAVDESKDSFFTWFNQAKDAQAAFIRGNWDFSIHIATPIANYIREPETKSILEIGHGGGRILASAAHHFQKAWGVDIHEHNELVSKELQQRGATNVELLQSDGKSIPLPDSSVDVAYSFIVFQHLEKLNILETYIQETYRVLKPGGVAILYFGRKRFFSLNRASKLLYYLDCLLELGYLRQGYQEMPARVNVTNLVVTAPFAKKCLRLAGFTPLAQTVSRKQVPDGVHLYGGQHGFVVQK